MNYEGCFEEKESLKLIGSQINLTPRSERSNFEYNKKCKPCSANFFCKSDNDVRRPKSAEYKSLNVFDYNSLDQRPNSYREPSKNGIHSKVSCFTDSSSRFLQNLLNGCRYDTSSTENKRKPESFSNLCSNDPLPESLKEFFTDPQNTQEKKYKNDYKINKMRSSSENLQTELWDPKVLREKSFRFSQDLQFRPTKKDFDAEESCSFCTEKEINLLNKEMYNCQVKPKSDQEQKIQEIISDNEQNPIITNCVQQKNEISSDETEVFQKPIHDVQNSTETNLDLKNLSKKHKNSRSREENLCEKIQQISNDFDLQKINSDSTYEEIVYLLQTLEEENCESLNIETKEGTTAEDGTTAEKIDYFNVSSYLEELEGSDNTPNENHLKNYDSDAPRLDELLNKNSVELAHEVFSLKIQMEDQKKGIKLLKDTLAEMRESKKNMELEHQDALNKVSAEAEAMVQRHQKFIKQLLNEKKNLNETVSKLIEDLKSGEEKHKKNIKTLEEKHLVEIKRVKEAQTIADKIKREKWMEIKTKKIKELTVKGLEPELSRIALRQQEEMTELRNLHKAEIEAIELRAARRTSELMDELRAELTKEKERAIAKETTNLRESMERDFDEERNKLQKQCQFLKDKIKSLEDKLSSQQLLHNQKLEDYKEEEEKRRQRIIETHQKDLEEVQRQHSIDLRNLREVLGAEKEIFVNNYKKQQAAKFLEREAELHQKYKSERDQEIEIIIETFEKESAQFQSELNQTTENKIKRLKEKMEAEIKEIEANEAALKSKLSEIKSTLCEKENFITELHSQIRQLQTELDFFKKECEKHNTERENIKDIIRVEFETSIIAINEEKANLEKEINVIRELYKKELAKKDQLNIRAKHEMQKELARVYSRIKTAIGKKEQVIESLRQENEAANQKCRQLELLLDQQRKNLLLQ